MLRVGKFVNVGQVYSKWILSSDIWTWEMIKIKIPTFPPIDGYIQIMMGNLTKRHIYTSKMYLALCYRILPAWKPHFLCTQFIWMCKIMVWHGLTDKFWNKVINSGSARHIFVTHQGNERVRMHWPPWCHGALLLTWFNFNPSMDK